MAGRRPLVGIVIGESNPWNASDFLEWAIARLGYHVGDDGVAAIDDLRQMTDGCHDCTLIVGAEQRRNVIESTYRPPTLGAVATALSGGPPAVVLAPHEIELLDRLAARQGDLPRCLATYRRQIARLGGYLARAHDPPPGNIVMWRGWSRLTDISLGANLVRATYG